MCETELSPRPSNTDNVVMSLILEALKKSEAERRLGETPGLTTLPVWKPRARASRAWWLLLPAIAVTAAAIWSNRDLLDGRVAVDERIAADATKKPASAAPDAVAGPAPSTEEGAGDAAALPRERPSSANAQRPASVAAAAPAQPMPEPQPMPQSMDDLDAMKGISPENQRRIRSGELFVPNPSLLAERGPTQEVPIVTAESALPPPLPEPGMQAADVPAAPDAMAADTQIDVPASTPDPSPAATWPLPDAPTAVAGADPSANMPAAVPATTMPPPPSNTAARSAVLSFYDLTLGQRQGLPALKMSMHVYHRDHARRFVIIDGQRLNEDGVMGNQLWAREIVPDGVIIEYRDIRFLLPRLGS
jgi:general secretion pathway protein B